VYVFFPSRLSLQLRDILLITFIELVLIPLSLATAQTSVIIAGDHKQLSSIVLSSVAKAKGLETSLLERLMNHPNYNPRNSGKTYVKLVRNYRSHPGDYVYASIECSFDLF
jgi:superfamily I DNA and/or RNA helicase